jgi:hypothetical protein
MSDLRGETQKGTVASFVKAESKRGLRELALSKIDNWMPADILLEFVNNKPKIDNMTKICKLFLVK